MSFVAMDPKMIFFRVCALPLDPRCRSAVVLFPLLLPPMARSFFPPPRDNTQLYFFFSTLPSFPADTFCFSGHFQEPALLGLRPERAVNRCFFFSSEHSIPPSVRTFFLRLCASYSRPYRVPPLHTGNYRPSYAVTISLVDLLANFDFGCRLAS